MDLINVIPGQSSRHPLSISHALNFCNYLTSHYAMKSVFIPLRAAVVNTLNPFEGQEAAT
jgi:hypothetical protein